MKYLILSERGDYLPVAIKLKAEGNDVVLIVKDVARKNIGHGLVDTAESWKDVNPDITILDIFKTHPTSRKLDSKVFGASQFGDVFFHRKEYFEEVCTLLDVDHDTSLFPDNAVEAWFNGDRFVLPTFKHTYFTRLMNDDIGGVVNDGWMGVHSWTETYLPDVLKKFEPTLKRVEYRGLFRLELNKVIVCHASNKLSIPTLNELLDVPLGKVIEQTVKGTLKHVPSTREKAVSVKISIPPYPYCPKFFWGHGHYNLSGSKLYEYSEPRAKHMWMLNIYKKNGTVLSAGQSGDLGYVTSRGITLKESRRRIMRTIKNLSIPALQYRSDI